MFLFLLLFCCCCRCSCNCCCFIAILLLFPSSLQLFVRCMWTSCGHHVDIMWTSCGHHANIIVAAVDIVDISPLNKYVSSSAKKIHTDNERSAKSDNSGSSSTHTILSRDTLSAGVVRKQFLSETLPTYNLPRSNRLRASALD